MPDTTISFEAGDIIGQVLSFGSPTPVEVAIQGPAMAANREHAPLLADEVVEPPRTGATVLPPPPRAAGQERGTGSRRCPAQSESNALLGRELGIDVPERALGVEQRVAELDERIPRGRGGSEHRHCGESRLRHGAQLLL